MMAAVAATTTEFQDMIMSSFRKLMKTLHVSAEFSSFRYQRTHSSKTLKQNLPCTNAIAPRTNSTPVRALSTRWPTSYDDVIRIRVVVVAIAAIID